ncbi:MAG: hypothetical protein UU26_C0009G0059 [Candidatus Daviesbacteria bacterium GW2011_GWC1_40_9]|nr:MAG: hypothetical protein UU26_C0009G0059 [Candidatus Daviesbacteria bacterium GW2011_GWC1_40_9]
MINKVLRFLNQADQLALLAIFTSTVAIMTNPIDNSATIFNPPLHLGFADLNQYPHCFPSSSPADSPKKAYYLPLHLFSLSYLNYRH